VKTASEVEHALEELEAWARDQGALKKHVIDELYKLKKEVCFVCCFAFLQFIGLSSWAVSGGGSIHPSELFV